MSDIEYGPFYIWYENPITKSTHRGVLSFGSREKAQHYIDELDRRAYPVCKRWVGTENDREAAHGQAED